LKRVCLFSHYYQGSGIPYYVQVYVNELSNYFDQIYLLTNAREIDTSVLPGIVRVETMENQGYDFGMFYKTVGSLNLSEISSLAFVNDSNILLGTLLPVFDWADTKSVDFWGLIDANINPGYGNYLDFYHVQSHFIVLQKKAISCLLQYYASIPVADILAEKDLKATKKMVINYWEIGLSQYLLAQGCMVETFVSYQAICKKNKLPLATNFSLKKPLLLIDNQLPILKKRLLTKLFVSKNLLYRALKITNPSLTLNYHTLRIEIEAIRQNTLLPKLNRYPCPKLTKLVLPFILKIFKL
jgi:lipopolysaccharide biosynthesis protein